MLHKFRQSFYHQILILARLVLVTEKMFVNEYFSSSSSLMKLTLPQSPHREEAILLYFYTSLHKFLHVRHLIFALFGEALMNVALILYNRLGAGSHSEMSNESTEKELNVFQRCQRLY